MGKKYMFTGVKKIIENKDGEEIVLNQIIALRDIKSSCCDFRLVATTVEGEKGFHTCVKKGEIGGWIENESNLSQEGGCWIDENSIVCENARVLGDALIYGNSKIYGNAIVLDNASIFESSIYDNARVEKDTEIYNSFIFENALVSGCSIQEHSYIDGSAKIFGRTLIKNSLIGENAKIYGRHFIKDSSILDYATIGEKDCSIKNYLGFNVEIYGCRLRGNAKVSQKQVLKDTSLYENIDENICDSIIAQTGLVPMDGYVIAYKIVREDLTSNYDPRFKYTIGEIVEAENVDENPEEACTSGLHFSHANYWTNAVGGSCSTFLIAKINLEDIVAVQKGEIRCRKALILGSYTMGGNDV